MRSWPRNPIVVIVVSLIVAVSNNPAGADQGEGTVLKQASNYHISETKPVETDDVQRKQWSLSVEEWSRYKTLMKGIRGSINFRNILLIFLITSSFMVGQIPRWL